MKSGLGDLMKQAQKLQEQMQKTQEELGQLEIVGESGAGLVKVTMSGRHEVRRVQLDPSVLGEAVEVIEDLVAAAVNDAVRRVEEENREKLSGLTAGVNLPGGFKMPF